MSAYIVEPEHINVLVSYMITQRASYWNGTDRVQVTRFNAEEVGRILLDENVRSVNYRYRDELDTEEKNASSTYRFAMSCRPISAVQIIKAVHCLDYQSCENDDWESTLAWKILQAILSTACHNLPGYDAAHWGVRAA